MEMESLTDAMDRLRRGGYTSDLTALADGSLRCRSCNARCDPAAAVVDQIVRFEGPTDPGDAAILIAMQCSCGHAGLFTAAYGADVSAEDELVLSRLPAMG